MALEGVEFCAVAYGNGQFLACGWVVTGNAPPVRLWSSTDGTSWVQHQPDQQGWLGFANQPPGLPVLAYGNGHFVAVAQDTIWQSGPILSLALTPDPASGLLTLSLTGQSDLACTVESSPDLLSWHPVTNITPVEPTTAILNLQPAEAGHLFYRAFSQ